MKRKKHEKILNLLLLVTFRFKMCVKLLVFENFYFLFHFILFYLFVY